jgi:protoporphyrin/coproporphyrin ferrochelatase
VTYDAFLLQSFGGPEGPDDVLPFLQNVTRGRGVPPGRLAAVAEHYHHFGGVSPINEQCRALLAALRPHLDLPMYWGNRNWHPYLADTLRQMRADGVTRAVSFVTSPYGSYSSCRQYLEDIEKARAEVGDGVPAVDKIRHYHDHPGFIEPFADAARAALVARPDARLVFTAHSIPSTMDIHSGPNDDSRRYTTQLAEASRLVAERAGAPEWDLVFQSRSGSPHVPWLEPDVNDHLESLAKAGVSAVVAVPIGFISDHLEVIWDLDNEAAETAARLGLAWQRVATPATDPRFVAMVAELVRERTSGAARRKLGVLPVWDACPTGCCLTRT